MKRSQGSSDSHGPGLTVLPGSQEMFTGASLVAQWIGVCLTMQGTQVRSLVWEDPTCCGATKPVCHNY